MLRDAVRKIALCDEPGHSAGLTGAAVVVGADSLPLQHDAHRRRRAMPRLRRAAMPDAAPRNCGRAMPGHLRLSGPSLSDPSDPAIRRPWAGVTRDHAATLPPQSKEPEGC
ncbi:MAG: hypothetical protein Q4G14_00085 [Paracoccus sp. (in: a-proteobacteria)]|uniref:hypothetical protein n=1 Tax=Paracoccus sp. TaxID=267 RepID=UPI0026E0D1A8|nr:hypothetical protein [Paracoccus sp. (in: a-proteobacteria)]MDO5611624.1 hypothetical protein [Paracoccus sp. (in: a-proteobacteria)]